MGVCVCWRGGSYEAPVYNLSLLITIFAKGKMDYFYIKIQFSTAGKTKVTSRQRFFFLCQIIEFFI